MCVSRGLGTISCRHCGVGQLVYGLGRKSGGFCKLSFKLQWGIPFSQILPMLQTSLAKTCKGPRLQSVMPCTSRMWGVCYCWVGCLSIDFDHSLVLPPCHKRPCAAARRPCAAARRLCCRPTALMPLNRTYLPETAIRSVMIVTGPGSSNSIGSSIDW